jgi:GntR family transcriptional regulator/MocR family aminotransferase
VVKSDNFGHTNGTGIPMTQPPLRQSPLTQTSWLGFAIDRSATTPVFEQICAAIRSQVASGDMALGSKLPPTRVFATELGVSRSTIVTAYEQLVAEGYLSSQQGSGYRLCSSGEVELAQGSDKTRKQPGSARHLQGALAAETESEAAGLAGERAQDAAGRSVARTETDPRPFRASSPDMRLFPYRQWAKTVARICRSDPQSMFVGSGGFGSLPLRQAICDHVAEWRGIPALPEQVVVTAGATDALEICLHTLSKAGDSTALEDPGYKPLLSYIQALGMKPEYLRIDENGAVLPAEPTASRLAILTPSHQFPLGGAMSPSRRLEFIQWAAETDGWII